MGYSVLADVVIKDANNDGTDASRSFSVDPVAGQTIIAFGSFSPSGGTGAPLVTNQWGVTFTILTSPYESTPNMISFVAYAHNISGSGPMWIKVHDSANTNTYQRWCAIKVTGLDPSGHDQTASQGSNSGTTTPSTGTTGTTTSANELAVAALGVGVGLDATSIAVGGSWTQRHERVNSQSGTTGPSGEDDTLDITATGTQSASWTLGTAEAYSAIIVTFKELAVSFNAAGSGSFAVVGGAQNYGSFGAAGSGTFAVTGSYTPPLGFAAAGQGSFSVVGILSTSARFSARGNAQFVVTPNSPGVSARFVAHGEAVFSVIPVPQTAPPTLLAPYGGLST
jgi:hypothetical protein